MRLKNVLLFETEENPLSREASAEPASQEQKNLREWLARGLFVRSCEKWCFGWSRIE